MKTTRLLTDASLMKLFFGLILFAPLLSAAQHNGGCNSLPSFWSAGASINFPANKGTAVGFAFSRNTSIGNGGVYVGAGTDLLRIQGGWYVPVSLNLVLLPLDKPIGPALVLAPGYGFYKQRETLAEKETTTTGGFTFYGGAGISFYKGMLTTGYSRFTFTTNKTTQSAGGVGIRLAVLL